MCKQKNKFIRNERFLTLLLRRLCDSDNRKNNDSASSQIINFMLITNFLSSHENTKLVGSTRISKVKDGRHNKL